MRGEWEGDRQRVRARARRRMLLWAIVSMCMVCVALFMKVLTHRQASSDRDHHDCPKRWVSGSTTHVGSCWCGWDGYCMCTPSLAIDTVVELLDPVTGEVDSVLVVRRRDNGKLACVGGFVEVGETLEQATRREVKEETGLEVQSLQMLPKVYDDPARDARRHTVSVAYVARTTGVPRAGSDAAEVVSIPLSSLRGQLGDFAFDHGEILKDYLAEGVKHASTTTVEPPPPPPKDVSGEGGQPRVGNAVGAAAVVDLQQHQQQHPQPAVAGKAKLRAPPAAR